MPAACPVGAQAEHERRRANRTSGSGYADQPVRFRDTVPAPNRTEQSGSTLSPTAGASPMSRLFSPGAPSTLPPPSPGPGARPKALGVWSGIAGGGAAFGLLLGGIPPDLLSWEGIFFVTAPVGLLARAAAIRFVPESRAEGAHR